MEFVLNGQPQSVPALYRDDRLLWLLRDHFGLRGPKLGCGIGACGACAVHVDGVLERACVVLASQVAGKQVVTLEGLGAGLPGGLHPVQRSWIDHSVPQCGYCQNGQIMAAAAVLAANPNAQESEVASVMDTILCRCGTQARIRTAVGHARSAMRGRT